MEISEELEVGVKVVHLVCCLCQRVQTSLLSSSNVDQVHSKDDDSLVTVADYSVQAVVSWILSEFFGRQNISIVAEEDSETLSKSNSSGLLNAVVKTVNDCLQDASKHGLKCPVSPLTPDQVIEAIRHCSSSGGHKGRHWVLDPVDGTLGFVRGNQYAVALALIEDGRVILGVLGCPNYPVRNGLINHQQHQPTPAVSPASSDMWEKGCVMYAKSGTGKAWMQPLLHGELKLDTTKFARPIRVSSIEDPALATFCEPVERANTSHSFSEGLAHSVGFRKTPLRVYSMVKYAAIARGDAEVYMKFARAGYKEKIWDHAAGVLIVQEAGGVVTDAGGRLLDFSKGIYLEGLDRGIIACSGAVLHEKIISAVYASWESSVL